MASRPAVLALRFQRLRVMNIFAFNTRRLIDIQAKRPSLIIRPGLFQPTVIMAVADGGLSVHWWLMAEHEIAVSEFCI